jgi:hypothetical protein
MELDLPQLDANLSIDFGEMGLQFDTQPEVNYTLVASTPKRVSHKTPIRVC